MNHKAALYTLAGVGIGLGLAALVISLSAARIPKEIETPQKPKRRIGFE